MSDVPARAQKRWTELVDAINAAGGRALAVKGDVTKPDDVRALVEATVKAFGGPTILVNNANIRSFRPLLELTMEEWRATLGPTLDGTLLSGRFTQITGDVSVRP